MENLIKQMTFSFIFLSIPVLSFPNDYKYEVKGKLPLEFTYMIDSYQSYELTRNEKESFKKLVFFFEESLKN